MRSLLLLALSLAPLGCGEDLTTDKGPAVDGLVATTTVDGELESAVQALDEDAWVRTRFEGDQLVHVEAADDANWHVRFRRIGVELGPGAEAVEIDGDAAAYTAATMAPAEGWTAEPPPETEGEDGRAGGPLASWFNYNPVNHTVRPGDRFYALRTADGGCYKLRFVSYYDDAGTTGVVTLRWATLDGCR